MKKLIVSLILAVILSLTLATPAFAGPPPEAEKGLNRTIYWNPDSGNDQSYQSMLQGTIAPTYYGKCPNAWFGPIVAYYKILELLAK